MSASYSWGNMGGNRSPRKAAERALGNVLVPREDNRPRRANIVVVDQRTDGLGLLSTIEGKSN